MITIEKIETNVKYHGDGDMFARISSKEETELFDIDDWQIINTSIQDIHFFEQGLINLEYRNRIESNFDENYNKEAKERLIEIGKGNNL